MEEQNGQKRPLGREPATTDTLALGAAVAICFGAGMSVGGIVAALSNGYKVGPYASFAGGLTAMIIGATSVSGGVALVCHRLQIKGNARTRAEIRDLTADVLELSRKVRTHIAIEEGRTEDAGDQVGGQRRRHEN